MQHKKKIAALLLIFAMMFQVVFPQGTAFAAEADAFPQESSSEELTAIETEMQQSTEGMESETASSEGQEETSISGEESSETMEETETAAKKSSLTGETMEETTEETTAEETVLGEDEAELLAANPVLSCSAYTAGIGWNQGVTAGSVCGNTSSGQLEAVKLTLTPGSSYTGSDIKYSVHMQTYGWLDETGSGTTNGKIGSGKRLEAMKIRLTGTISGAYDIYYRAYVEGYGWLDWAKNGAPAGSSGYSKRLMAYQVVLNPKGAAAPGSTNKPFMDGSEPYPNTHVNTGNRVKDIVAIAKTQVGYSIAYEGLPTKYGTWYNTFIGATGSYYPSAPWCAMFVSWCADQAGVPKTVFRYNASTVNQATWYQKVENPGNWHDRRTDYVPQAGDLIFFKYSWNSNYVNHVGLVTGSSGGMVYTIEGNTSDSVKEHSYSLDNTNIVGYATPDYAQKGIGDKVFERNDLVGYSVNVEGSGWTSSVSDGATAGTVGAAKRMQALKISLNTNKISGGIKYRSYMQSYRWLDWQSNGAVSGIADGEKRMEAVEIQLTGEAAQNYDVYYRVHVQTYGWLDWAKNGASAGTADLARRIEAIEIRLVKKGGAAPGSTKKPFIQGDPEPVAPQPTEPQPTEPEPVETPSVSYRTHCQTYGWLKWVADGTLSGTTGQAKRLEAIKIALDGTDGGIKYQTHIQTYGWTNWKADGAMSGTQGEAKRMEGIRIRLTGAAAEKYDIYYRVHIQTYGWLGWAKNGASAGSSGLAKRMEGIEIVIVKKGESAPGTTKNCFIAG